ncbi:MAG: transcription termination/antitermination protein NusA [Bacteroidetes bacterium]|nr:MAG: transcription termination/antitermination protein NusA [Bacteroidota bacterium]
MNNKQDLIQSFLEFKEQKRIDRPTMAGILEDVFRSVLVRNYGSDDNYDVIINMDKGDFEIWRVREVVEDGDVTDPNRQISLSEARRIEGDYEVGEDVSELLKFEDFARRNILAIGQNLRARISDLEKGNLMEEYSTRIGTMITAEIHQIRKREVILLDDDGHELILPKSEQIPSDFFRKGDTVRGVIESVEMGNSSPRIIVSRTSPKFLECLMEQEVPEIFDGLITIKKVVRIPGERAKVAVESYDDRIDPVGACVGMKGSRIHGIVRELRNENIDVISYTTNVSLLITRSLSPAKIASMEIDEEQRTVSAYLLPNEVSKAIGKNGYNIRLASQLTGYNIDVFRDADNDLEEDLSLDEFADEIDAWVIEALKRIGCDTAKSVLDMSPTFLVQHADLEEETVSYVLEVLRREVDEEAEADVE